MSSPSTVLSQTLQSLTSTKFRELAKQRRWFDARKNKILEGANQAEDQQSRVSLLLSGLEGLNRPNADETSTAPGDILNGRFNDRSLENISRFVEQSRYDPTISPSMLDEFHRELHRKIEQQTHRFDFADVHSRLLMEWLNPPDKSIAEIPSTEETALSDSFEILERDRLQQLREKFEAVAFEPVFTDEVEIEKYMSAFFEGDASSEALQKLRSTVWNFGNSLATRVDPFDTTVLDWCIKSLLRNDLLNDQQKSILEEFNANDVVLGEIADVLNMRWTDLQNWSWEAEEGMFYEPRRQLNGKYRIMMDEDILQAIFLHYIGIIWSVQIKKIFRTLVANGSVWKRPAVMSSEEHCRREYYLGRGRVNTSGGMHQERYSTYQNDYFMCALPNSVEEGAGVYDEDEDTTLRGSKVKSANEIKQQLLRQIATEVLIGRSLYGEVAVVQSDLLWYATGLPHTTIFAVLRFFGVPETWISFFRKFAEAPLRMSDAPGAEVRIRKRGIPMAHAIEKFLGEVILYAMDIAINQESGMLLYRMHDDLWFCGSTSDCVKAWRTMEEFGRVMGLEYNKKKTGSVCLADGHSQVDERLSRPLPQGSVAIGLLKLDPSSGTWVIDQPQVDAHVKQLQKQLAACTSILSWVQTWNSCIGRFFVHTFGEPANCFGRRHVDSILETHANMQRRLFNNGGTSSSSVTEYLQNLLASRLAVTNVPDSFLFLPEELGGLGLRNAFISFVIREDLHYRDPEHRMEEYKAQEREAYWRDKEAFDALSEHERRRRFKSVYHDKYGYYPNANTQGPSGDLGDPFMSFEDYTRFRDTTSYSSLQTAYQDLMRLPRVRNVTLSREVLDALDSLREPDLSPRRLDSETRWILQLYAAELFARFGGLSIVDKGLLPLGVMRMLRSKKVTWQMVL